MAKSKYEYVKGFEQDDSLLKECYIIVRVDGKGFHEFTAKHGYERPNDIRGLQLMNCCAMAILREFPDVVLGYGESDEYSFLIKKESNMYNRRARYDTCTYV